MKSGVTPVYDNLYIYSTQPDITLSVSDNKYRTCQLQACVADSVHYNLD